MNFILKDNSEGGSLSVDAGEYYEGDGQSVTITGNIGLPLGDSGFFSLSGEYSDSDFGDLALGSRFVSMICYPALIKTNCYSRIQPIILNFGALYWGC